MKYNECFAKLIAKRIDYLRINNNLSINKLAMLSFLTQSTLESIMNCNSNNPKIITLLKICYGLKISLSEFFDDDMFKQINFDHII